MKKANNVQIAQVQPFAFVLSFCLFFCQFQSAVAYEHKGFLFLTAI